MVRSRRSTLKEDTSLVLADSGISLSSPPLQNATLQTLLKNGKRKKERNSSVAYINTDDDNETAKDNTTPAYDASTDVCKIKSLSSSQLGCRTRLRKAHNCHICSKVFGGKTDLTRHILIHSDERPYKCSYCSKSYRQAINLKNHTVITHEQQPCLKCPKCPKTFPLKERLRLHMRLHSGEKPYACNTCDKRFPRAGQLQHHVITYHSNASKKYICEKCNAALSTPANLRAHMERHLDGPEHFCDICCEHFQNDVILRAHVNNVHHKFKEFECQICRRTVVGEDLATHLKRHTNIKTYICEVCNSYFTQKSQYNVHMRMHTGERPYQCRICWQTFAHSSVLKLHIRKHTGEKPFSCPLCAKNEVAFSQLAHLKTHMKKIHKQNDPYMCAGCSQFFKVKAELKAHIKQCSSYMQHIKNEERSSKDDEVIMSRMRFSMALLLKKISSEEKLRQLGFEKRLVDNVVIAALKLAGRKAYDDHKLSAMERLRLNVDEFLDWIVPEQPLQDLRKEQMGVESVLDKIVMSYMKQK